MHEISLVHNYIRMNEINFTETRSINLSSYFFAFSKLFKEDRLIKFATLFVRMSWYTLYRLHQLNIPNYEYEIINHRTPRDQLHIMLLYISLLMQLKVMKLGGKVLFPNKTTNNVCERVANCDCSSCIISGIESREISPCYKFAQDAI